MEVCWPRKKRVHFWCGGIIGLKMRRSLKIGTWWTIYGVAQQRQVVHSVSADDSKVSGGKSCLL